MLRPAEFQAVFDASTVKVGEARFLLLTCPNGSDHPRLGLVVAKKKVRRSVDRNRVKRVVRESFRLHQAQLPAHDVIFMARQDLASCSREQLRAELDQAWKRLTRKAARCLSGEAMLPAAQGRPAS